LTEAPGRRTEVGQVAELAGRCGDGAH
jgi:hypothetical protein